LNTPSVVARFYWISTTQTSAMSYSISTLLIRNLRDVFGENDPRVGARPSTRSTPKTVCFYDPAREFTVAVTRSIASQARSRLLTLTFYISQLPSRGIGQWRAGPMGIGPTW